MVQSDVYAENSGDVLREGVEAAEERLWVINPTGEMLRGLISAFRGPASPVEEPIRLFVARKPLKEMADDFLLASLAAELVEEGRLDVRLLASVPRHSLLVTERSVVSVIDGEDRVAGLTTTAEAFVESVQEEYTGRWERAEAFSFRTPPLSTIRTTLKADIGPAAAEEFDRALAALEADREAPGVGTDGLDEVTVALLVAASNDELLYDISRWGEDIRLASKATFSRTKKRLEEAGLVETEKVPIEVGRPRLRLVLPEGSRDADIETVVRQSRARLA